ncbi:hypothetical protein EX30DRAFT_271291 [Ascodesmis nigricans]|uniref:Uncharacterized protein n=1 Tax=Ascodesmis nigricans TaxID=341454 RepID=A0A4S2MXA0_9PEZI|nr:hypothetical protein EX30DRAFT_271291 [Ascodesmis nigricans]
MLILTTTVLVTGNTIHIVPGLDCHRLHPALYHSILQHHLPAVHIRPSTTYLPPPTRPTFHELTTTNTVKPKRHLNERPVFELVRRLPLLALAVALYCTVVPHLHQEHYPTLRDDTIPSIVHPCPIVPQEREISPHHRLLLVVYRRRLLFLHIVPLRVEGVFPSSVFFF